MKAGRIPRGSWRLALSDGEIMAVVQYVRQLGKTKGTAP